LIFVALTFISRFLRYEILYAKYVDLGLGLGDFPLLDKLKEVKKIPIFSTATLHDCLPGKKDEPRGQICSLLTKK
jgi:hypothetical protein